MQTWVPTVVATFIVLLVNMVLQFYFKWVPDVEKQKRHLQRFIFWIVDICTIAAFAWALYYATQRAARVTPLFVVTVAVECGAISTCVTFMLLRRAGGPAFIKHLDNFGKVLGIIEKHSEFQSRCRSALQLLAQDANLSPENLQTLKELIGDAESERESIKTGKPLLS